MSEQIKELEQSLISLKARLFDANEIAAANKKMAESLSSALAQIAAHLGIKDEQIDVKDIVEASKQFGPKE